MVAGENDFVYALTPQQKRFIENSARNVASANGPTLTVTDIFNWAKPPFNNMRVRKAFNFAIDREAFVKATLRGSRARRT